MDICLFLYKHNLNFYVYFILQNGLEECCHAVLKRQIDGDELLVSTLFSSSSRDKSTMLMILNIGTICKQLSLSIFYNDN